MIETDLHMSSDGKIVIAHDIDTRRVFGKQFNITQTKYSGVLDNLLTLKTPRSPMPLFEDVLKWCVKINEYNRLNDGETVKIMLDIKVDNDPSILYPEIFKLFEEIQGIDYWRDKIVFGLWRIDFFLPDLLHGFPIAHISFDFHKAKAFYAMVKEDFSENNIFAVSMINLIVYREKEFKEFLSWLNAHDLKLWLWTINTNYELQKVLEFCKHSEDKDILDGLITDDPIGVFDPNKNNTWLSHLRMLIRSTFYSIILTLMRKKYDITYLVKGLKKIGFV